MLLVGNIRAVEAFLIDGQSQRITSPVVGEQIAVQLNFETQSLAAGASYDIRFVVNGIPLTSGSLTSGAGLAQGTFSSLRSGWFASLGNNTVTVLTDSGNAIAETNELDNAVTLNFLSVSPTTLPGKLYWPVSGRQDIDWSVVNYIDVDPRSNVAADFRGGPFQYEGHDAYDITLPNYTQMDQGVSAVAVAGGTVTEVVEGNFDRETASNGRPGNHVRINHGNGWTSLYLHLATNTTTVKVGDAVAAGQMLGLLGSSGNSTDAHLHFSLYHHGRLVETNYASSDYFATPHVYQGDLTTAAVDSGITNYDVVPDLKERPSDRRSYQTQSSDTLTYWARLSSLKSGDQLRIEWIRPNGTVAASGSFTPTVTERFSFRTFTLASTVWNQTVGSWRAILSVNGNPVDTQFFVVSSLATIPEVRVRQGTRLIVDGRTTPIDFTAAPLNGNNSARALDFTIENHGGSALALSGLRLPTGFRLAGNFPSTVAAGGNATFTLELPITEFAGRFGEVRFVTNDVDEDPCSFNVQGPTTASASPYAPILTLTSPAAAIYRLGIPVLVAPSALLADIPTPTGSSTLNGSLLRVWLSSGGESGDVLRIRNQGLGPQQVSISGSSVLYSGIVIGTFSGGTSTSPLDITFNGLATLTAVQAVAANVLYEDDPTNLIVTRRYVAFQFRDSEGFWSAQRNRTVAFKHNEAPTELLLSSSSVTENRPAGTLVGNFQSIDPDNRSVFTYSFVSGLGGGGNSSFTIEGNALRTAAPFDFETRPNYTIRVQTEDQGGLTLQKIFSIAVIDVNEPPTDLTISELTLFENQPAQTGIGVFSTVDPDANSIFTYTLENGVGSADNIQFEIFGNQLRSLAPFDFEARSSYSIRVQSRDQGGAAIQRQFSVQIVDVNEAPTTLSLSNAAVAESKPLGTVVGLLSSLDPDTVSSHSFELISGVGDLDNSRFEIVGNELRTAEVFDYESRDTYSVRIRSTDQGLLSIDNTFTVTVTNVNEAPIDLTFVGDPVPENQPGGSFVGRFTTTDTDLNDTHSYSLVSGVGGADNSRFSIVGNELRTAASLDFEAQSGYSVRVQSTDSGGLNLQRVFVITVTDANDPPNNISLSPAAVDENRPPGTSIGTFSATDVDPGDSHTFTLVPGPEINHNAFFSIVGGQLLTQDWFDFEHRSSYTIRVQARDQAGAAVQKNMIVAIRDVNEAPTAVQFTNVTKLIRENQSTNQALPLADVVVVDDATGSNALQLSGADASFFELAGTQLRLRAGTVLDRVAKSRYSVMVSVDDSGVGGNPDAWAEFVLQVTAVAPTVFGPASPTDSLRPAITWTPVAGAVSYEVSIANQTTNVLLFHLGTAIGTSYVPGSDLGIGQFGASVRAVFSNGQKSFWAGTYVFRINSRTVLQPIDANQPELRPTIRWNSLTGATQYDVWVGDITLPPGRFLLSQRVTEAAWTPAADLPLGKYRIWVRGVDAAGVTAQWSAFSDFRVAQAPILTAPIGSTFSRRPVFEWNAVNGAVRYEVFVRNMTDGTTTHYDRQVFATLWTAPADLPVGPYRWWSLAIGAGESRSLWSKPTDIYIGGRPEVLTPFGSGKETRPFFTWKPVGGAASFQLRVERIDSVPVDVINAANIIENSFASPVTLTPGLYRIWVRAVSVSGEISAWNQEVAFRILTFADPPVTNSPTAGLDRSLLTSLRSPLTGLIETDRQEATNPVPVPDQAPADRDGTTEESKVPAMKLAVSAQSNGASGNGAVSYLDAVMSEFLLQDFTLQDFTLPTVVLDRR